MQFFEPVYDHIYFVAVFYGSLSQNKDLRQVSITSAEIHEISDHLFGHFFKKYSRDQEIGGNPVIDPETDEYHPVIPDRMRSLNVSNLRFPGGADVELLSVDGFS